MSDIRDYSAVAKQMQQQQQQQQQQRQQEEQQQQESVAVVSDVTLEVMSVNEAERQLIVRYEIVSINEAAVVVDEREYIALYDADECDLNAYDDFAYLENTNSKNNTATVAANENIVSGQVSLWLPLNNPQQQQQQQQPNLLVCRYIDATGAVRAVTTPFTATGATESQSQMQQQQQQQQMQPQQQQQQKQQRQRPKYMLEHLSHIRCYRLLIFTPQPTAKMSITAETIQTSVTTSGLLCITFPNRNSSSSNTCDEIGDCVCELSVQLLQPFPTAEDVANIRVCVQVVYSLW